MKKLLLILWLFCHTLHAYEDPKLAKERIIFHTIAGDIVFALYPEIAPKHVAQIKKLVEAGAYNTTHFFRVEPGFVLQTSLVEDRTEAFSEQVQRPIPTIPLELGPIDHHPFSLSMARADNDENSATSSFSIILGNAKHLDGKYTVFGKVESGFGVISELIKVPRTVEGLPSQRLTINSAEVVAPDELASRTLAAAQPIYVPKAPPRFLTAAFCLIILVSLIAFAAAKKLRPSTVVSLHLLNVLVASFTLLVSFGEVANTSHWLGGVLMIAALGVFRLMSQFESAN